MKATQIIVNGVPKETFSSLKKAKQEGKRLIREFKKQNVVLGINIDYKSI